MITTKKRISIALDQQDLKKLEDLCQFAANTPSNQIKHAIRMLHYHIFKDTDQIRDIDLRD